MNRSYNTHWRCTICQKRYALDAVTYTCPTCGPAGTLDLRYDFERLKSESTRDQISAGAEFTMWRYRPLLPALEDSHIPTLPVGGTPLVSAPRLADRVGVQALWIKDEGRNPTGSLKDRASAMVVARARQIGAKVVTTASTGNAAAALSGICASVGMTAVIFVPATAPEAKIAQLLIYGAVVFLVQGTYDEAFDLCVQASEKYGWYCRNTGINPYTTEGKKTAAFEIAEQLGWVVPDVVVVGVGDGSIIGGQFKGYADLVAAGWTEKMPRLIGVQAEGSSNLTRAWRKGQDPATMSPGPSETIADSISASLPRDRVKAIRAVRESGGVYVSVPDEKILAAIPELARMSGVFAEPAAAATLAGLHQAQLEGAIGPTDRVVLMVTGSGLKDIHSARKSLGSASGYPVKTSIEDVERLVTQLELV